MKSTGITRQIDHLGRIVIPKDLRKRMNIRDKKDEERDHFQIFFDENEQIIVLKKHTPGCRICGSTKDLVKFRGEMFCKSCINDMHEKVEKGNYQNTEAEKLKEQLKNSNMNN